MIKKLKENKKGFTLVELIVVLVGNHCNPGSYADSGTDRVY